MGYLQKLRKTILWMDNDFEELYRESAADALMFFALTLLLGCAITSAGLLLEGVFAILDIPFFLLLYAIGWGMCLPVSTHLLLKVFGWGKPAAETFKAYFYGGTPLLLFGWLPCFGALVMFIAAGNVIRYLQGDKKGGYWKPLCAVVVPGAIAFGLLVYLLVLAEMGEAP